MLKKRKAKTEKPEKMKAPKISEAQASVDVGNSEGRGVRPTKDGAGVVKMSKKPMRIMNIRKFDDRSAKIYMQDGSHHAVTDEWFSENQPKANGHIILRDGELVCIPRDEAVALSK